MRHLEAYDLVWRGMQEPFIGVGMGLTAENLAEKYAISRQEQDAFAAQSHQRAARAIDGGRFKAEITPFQIPQRKKAPLVFDTDEHVRRDANLEMMAKPRTLHRTCAYSGRLNEDEDVNWPRYEFRIMASFRISGKRKTT